MQRLGNAHRAAKWGPQLLVVSTGSRLHFGLLELAAAQPNRFGGLGIMLADPGWTLQFSTPRDSTTAPTIDTASTPNLPEILRRSGDKTSAQLDGEILLRIEQVRSRFAALGKDVSDIAVTVTRILPLHSGLGAGTQLAAAVAFGFEHYLRFRAENLAPSSGYATSSQMSLDELIRLSGRGKRSGIGLYGFLNSGLIFDQGLPPTANDSSPRQVQATAQGVQPNWRIVLVSPPGSPTVTGGIETSLIATASQTPNPNKSRMLELACMAMEWSQRADGFDPFVAILEEFVQLAGQLFAPCQGGIYNGETLENAAQLMHQVGLRAVGQSSWGPTLFGFAHDEQTAHQTAHALAMLRADDSWKIEVARPANHAATWQWR
jgi:beta-ribofuranosylaminobenzene 5'-phosphate synthase